MVQNVKAGKPRFSDGAAAPGQVGKTKEDWIGNQFRRIYDEALDDDIPDDMMSLLEQLDGISLPSAESDDNTSSTPGEETSK
ncbi:NepR family anti-sigma factor [Roseibium aestuarii]|uniref:NepR family anti-sigma factor n=1 Tax=Roseibium aestuarii TaxID=2600299 RepID=A0ABW4JXF4_9HYPH|nr:NepR family anti-sigma factor [Roseibium aestuarii]